jgi:hypothetical protein
MKARAICTVLSGISGPRYLRGANQTLVVLVASGLAACRRKSDSLDVGGFLALRAVGTLKAYALVLCQALEAVADHVLEMNEQVVAACVRGNETEALGVVEPFYDPGLAAHGVDPSFENF